jgi:hypothetical protein
MGLRNPRDIALTCTATGDPTAVLRRAAGIGAKDEVREAVMAERTVRQLIDDIGGSESTMALVSGSSYRSVASIAYQRERIR